VFLQGRLFLYSCRRSRCLASQCERQNVPAWRLQVVGKFPTLPGMAGRFIAQIVVAGAQVFLRAFAQAYQQAAAGMYWLLHFWLDLGAAKNGGAAAAAGSAARKTADAVKGTMTAAVWLTWPSQSWLQHRRLAKSSMSKRMLHGKNFFRYRPFNSRIDHGWRIISAMITCTRSTPRKTEAAFTFNPRSEDDSNYLYDTTCDCRLVVTKHEHICVLCSYWCSSFAPERLCSQNIRKMSGWQPRNSGLRTSECSKKLRLKQLRRHQSKRTPKRTEELSLFRCIWRRWSIEFFLVLCRTSDTMNATTHFATAMHIGDQKPTAGGCLARSAALLQTPSPTGHFAVQRSQ